jgi:hypothetical protein
VRKYILALAMGFLAITTSGCAAPPPPPHHPAYLQALSELRTSRWLIEHRRPSDPTQSVDEVEAVRQIDAAISDLKQAAYDDGKNLNDHPPVEDTGEWRGRLHNALDHLNRAHSEIAREEDNAYASGLRGRALGHLDAAINATRRAIGS